MTQLRTLIATLAVGAMPIVFSGCGAGSSAATPFSVQPGALHQLGSRAYQTIYTFPYCRKGPRGPSGEFTAIAGVFYGTTDFGGHGFCYDGTLFSLTPSGEERTIFKFNGNGDGHNPNGPLVALDGVLYGTTSGGGGGCLHEAGCGTVFAVTTSGKRLWVYHFKGGTGGITPSGGLVLLDGKLYGTTTNGGITSACPSGSGWAAGCGIVFSIDTSGNERVLYRFRGDHDGLAPNAPLVALNGKLYGTTSRGGDYRICYGGCGTLFELTTSGVEKVLHRFRNGRDGGDPNGGLLVLDGVLYGTTLGGGGKCNGSQCGYGTFYKATTSGGESVLYAFKGIPDAVGPYGRLVVYDGLVYGTASGGENCGYTDSGTIFAVSTAGAEHVAYTFSCKSVIQPTGLTELERTLYGSASQTIFAFTP
jgi:uncharacterized repeat protein (TIGR03803 family)